jgi:hypothetical protein
MAKSRNPFIYGGAIPSSRFVGRKRQVNRVLERLTSDAPGNFAIGGERLIGKTSFLNYVEHEGTAVAKDQLLFVSLDCQSIGAFTPTRFWKRVLKLLSKKVSQEELKKAVDQVYKKGAIVYRDLEGILDETRGLGQKLVLLLDEFEWVLGTDVEVMETATVNFLAGFRALLNQMPGAISVVISTGEPIYELCPSSAQKGSPFYNNFIFIWLKEFTEPEARELIETYLQGTGVNFTEDDKKFAYEVSEGRPYFLQLACHRLFERYVEGDGE